MKMPEGRNPCLLARLLASYQLRNFPREFTEKCFAAFDQSSHAIYLTCTMAETCHMISFLILLFLLFSFVIFVLMFSLFSFRSLCFCFNFVLILLSFCSFSLLDFSYSFFFNCFFKFYIVFWNETKWKPGGWELTKRLKQIMMDEDWHTHALQQYVRLNYEKD